MKLVKRLVVLTLCISSVLYAEWDPSFLLQDSPGSDYLLNKPSYVNLKKRIVQELKNSWCSVEKINLLMDLTLLTHPKICVEIGAFTGSSILPVAATLKYSNFGKMFAIDAWSNTEATKYLADNDPNKQWWAGLDMRSVHSTFRSLIKTWSLGNFCTEICKPSTQAIFDVPAEIDFLHFDGDYSETGSLKDVELYLPKVKSGGYILFSGLYTCVNDQLLKKKAFCLLFDSGKCDMVWEIERANAVLFRKI